MENSLEFREIRTDEYWPPVLPNGNFFAVPAGHDQVMEILSVTDEGLRCSGVSYEWPELQGVAITDDLACLVSRKYISGGVRFYISTCVFEGDEGRQMSFLNGYPVGYCLMNRIIFENQRAGNP